MNADKLADYFDKFQRTPMEQNLISKKFDLVAQLQREIYESTVTEPRLTPSDVRNVLNILDNLFG